MLLEVFYITTERKHFFMYAQVMKRLAAYIGFCWRHNMVFGGKFLSNRNPC